MTDQERVAKRLEFTELAMREIRGCLDRAQQGHICGLQHAISGCFAAYDANTKSLEPSLLDVAKEISEELCRVPGWAMTAGKLRAAIEREKAKQR